MNPTVLEPGLQQQKIHALAEHVPLLPLFPGNQGQLSAANSRALAVKPRSKANGNSICEIPSLCRLRANGVRLEILI